MSLIIYIIDKFVVTKIGFVFIRILGGHSFLWHGIGNLIFNCIFCIQSNLELHVFTRFYTLQSLSRYHFNI